MFISISSECDFLSMKKLNEIHTPFLTLSGHTDLNNIKICKHNMNNQVQKLGFIKVADKLSNNDQS
jgi:hypothetical protein